MGMGVWNFKLLKDEGKKKATFITIWCLTWSTLVTMTESFYYTVENNTREGNGTPLQYSCLENPMDGGAC